MSDPVDRCARRSAPALAARTRMLRLVLILGSIVFAISSCSSDGAESPRPDGPQAGAEVGAADLAQHEADIAKRFRGPELSAYLMLPDSFVGGTFPHKVAVLLREVEALEAAFLVKLQSLDTTNEAVLESHRAFLEFAGLAAALYERMAEAPRSIRAMRDGLEIADPSLADEYNSRVDEVNAARDRFEASIRALTTEQQASFSRMGLTVRLR